MDWCSDESGPSQFKTAMRTVPWQTTSLVRTCCSDRVRADSAKRRCSGSLRECFLNRLYHCRPEASNSRDATFRDGYTNAGAMVCQAPSGAQHGLTESMPLS